MKQKITIMLTCSFFLIIACTQDLSKFAGKYRNIKKIDSYDSSATVYSKSSRAYNSGIQIDIDGDKLTATSIRINKPGKSSKMIKRPPLKLEKTDDGIFQYKSKNRSTVNTFIFSEKTLIIDEYGKDKLGNIKKESRKILEKI